MVNVFAAPSQVAVPLVKCGVTVIVAVTGAFPVFTAVTPGRFPVPDAAKPMLVVLLVHEYVVVPPVLAVLNITGEVAVLWQTT